MSTSLRDQLLKAGLINQKQANEVERQQQRQERRPGPKQQRVPGTQPKSASPAAQSAKVARDLALNRRQQEKADSKARLAQIKQLIEQNRLPTPEGDATYNFVDGGKIRRIAVDAQLRDRLIRGELAIVHHDARYDLVPAAIAVRIRERDELAIVPVTPKASAEEEDAYQQYSVPDDLIW